MGAVTYATLEHVAEQARPYPAHLLDGCETGLCLFAAAFLGHNDAIHFAEAGLHTTCIDIDEDRLGEMRELYPSEWEFAVFDAWDYARRPALGPYLGRRLGRHVYWLAHGYALVSLELWMAIANRLVTVTVTVPVMYEIAVPMAGKHRCTRGRGMWPGSLWSARVRPKAPFRALRFGGARRTSLLTCRAGGADARRVQGRHGALVIGLRHDVDDNPGSFETASQWPSGSSGTAIRRPISCCTTRTTGTRTCSCESPEFEELGHEVGIHVQRDCRRASPGSRSAHDPRRWH